MGQRRGSADKMKIRSGLSFGPFKCEFFNELVDDTFVDSAVELIEKELVPKIQNFERFEGKINTNYDEERFLGANSACKYFFNFEGEFFVGDSSDTVWCDLRYNPKSKKLESRRFPHIETRLEKEKRIKEEEESEAKFERRKERLATIVQLFELDTPIQVIWSKCRELWLDWDVVMSNQVGTTWKTPPEHYICVEISKKYLSSKEFIKSQLMDPDPRISAYAFKILTRMDFDPSDIPKSVLSRKDEFLLHHHSRVNNFQLGSWILEFLEDFEPGDIEESDKRNDEWQNGPLAEYEKATKRKKE